MKKCSGIGADAELVAVVGLAVLESRDRGRD